LNKSLIHSPQPDSSFSGSEKRTKSKFTLAVTRTDAHARADSHTLGNLLLNLPQSPSSVERTVYNHARAESTTLPSGSLPGTRQVYGENENHVIEEEEETVQFANSKVSRWLAEGPTSTPLQQPVDLSMSDPSFVTRGTASFDTWRTILETETIDDGQMLSQVERLALKGEEIRKCDDVERDHGIKDQKTALGSRSPSGRKQKISDINVTPSSNRFLKETKRRTFRFLPTRTVHLPPSPALPPQSVSHANPVSVASASVATVRQAVNPRMHA